ncbi:MAG: hypothetical protein RIB97_01015 [Nitratireductor sp.]
MQDAIGAVDVQIRAELIPFRRGLDEAKREAQAFDQRASRAFSSVDKEVRSMNRAVGDSQREIRGLATVSGTARNAMAGLFAGVVGAVSVGAMVGGLRDAAEAIASIGDEARLAGLSAKVFQEWKAVAIANRIPVDALADAFKELNIRADEFATTGKGSAAEAFARLGLTPTEVKERLKDPSEFMLLLIERTKALKDTSAGVRIFDELFGGQGGERFVALLDQGTDSIRATIDQAHRLGNVIDDAMIQQAAEVDRQFKIVSQTVGNALKSAIVNAATALQDFIDRFDSFEMRRDASLDSDLANLGKERLDVERQIMELQDKQRRGVGVGDGILGSGVGESTHGEAMADAQRRLEAIAAEETMILRVLEARRKVREASPGGSPAGGWTPPSYTPPAASGGKSTKERANEYERLTERIADATAAQVAETEAQRGLNPLIDDFGYAVERARIEFDLLTAAQASGKAITPALRDEIGALADQYSLAAAEAAKLREEQILAQKQVQFHKELVTGVMSDLRHALNDGKLSWQELADVALNALDTIIDKLLNDLIDAIFEVNNAAKSGGGGGIFDFFADLLGGIFGGGDRWDGMRVKSADGNVFDAGRIVPHSMGDIVDRPSLFPMRQGIGSVAEVEPEAIMPLRRGPNGRLGIERFGERDSGGSPVYQDNRKFNIDARGAQQGVAEQIREAISDYDDTLPDKIQGKIESIRDKPYRRTGGWG